MSRVLAEVVEKLPLTVTCHVVPVVDLDRLADDFVLFATSVDRLCVHSVPGLFGSGSTIPSPPRCDSPGTMTASGW